MGEIRKGAQLELVEDVLEAATAEVALLLDRAAAEEQREFSAFGRTCRMRRKQLFFGPAGYTFSRITLPPQAAPDPLVARCLAVAQRWLPGANAALVNLYADGTEYISAHSDDEPVHGKGEPILTFSFGAERTLRIRDKKTRTQLLDVPLPSHSVAIMSGPVFQAELTHEIPVQKRVLGWRLSVTVRRFVV